jgi:hypothetical protein
MRTRKLWSGIAGLLASAAIVVLAQGPPKSPSQGTSTPSAGGAAQAGAVTAAPSMPVEEIILRFAAREAEFRQARDNYTYTQTVRVQEFDLDGRAGGEFRRTSDVIFTPEGKRFEHITYEPPSTLRKVSLTREDLQDLANIQPFVLTTGELPSYIVEYQGREKVDEIGTYVFRVQPRRIERDQRYFEGTIWVDDQDLQIVKTYGKAVPDIRGRHQENLFPRFETYRENIDSNYWFPTYTRTDDVLHFRDSSVRIHMLVRYSNYKQFKTSVRLLDAQPVKPDEVSSPKPPPKF